MTSLRYGSAICCASLLLRMATAPATAEQAGAAADVLKIVLCGTSGPLAVPDRAKPCVAIQAGGVFYLVDIGPEATENIMRWRLPLADARAVFITHLHSDHIGGLGEFNMQSWVNGRSGPLAVVGPDGVDKLAAGFNLAYEADHAFRRAHHEHGDVKLPLDAGLLRATVVTIPETPEVGPRRAPAWSVAAPPGAGTACS